MREGTCDAMAKRLVEFQILVSKSSQVTENRAVISRGGSCVEFVAGENRLIGRGTRVEVLSLRRLQRPFNLAGKRSSNTLRLSG